MDSGNEPTSIPFHPGAHHTTRTYRRVTRPREASPRVAPYKYIPWAERITEPPAVGRIRLLDPPSTAANNLELEMLWNEDLSLTEWTKRVTDAKNPHPISAALREPDFVSRMEAIFYGNQRKRWLAFVVLHRWTQRVWRRRTQCNVDMIDMQPIADKDAIFLTDTKHHTIFRFHRSDVFKNLLTNICMADEMLPAPRYPTNPWTNSVLTMPQTLGLCQQLVADYAKRGLCPPVLFSAFWAARFCIKRFTQENSAALAQHAIRSYFKDLHEYNIPVVFDTISSLLLNAGLDFSPVAIRRWLLQTQTPLHIEWLELVRDYTLYINLHIQVRPNWYNESFIDVDVARLYARTIPNTRVIVRPLRRFSPQSPVSPSVLIEVPTDPQGAPIGLLGLPVMIMDISANDILGSDLSYDMAIQLIRNALFQP